MLSNHVPCADQQSRAWADERAAMHAEQEKKGFGMFSACHAVQMQRRGSSSNFWMH